MISAGICLLGTDTGVGKTSVACGLLRLALRRNLCLRPFKPVETGCTSGLPTDGERLITASRRPDPATPPDPGVTIYRFSEPVAPSVAARLAGQRIDLDLIADRVATFLGDGAPLLVETAGGVMTPYGPRVTSASIVQHLSDRFGFDILLVSANRLGTINQTALALDHLTRAGLPVTGVVLTDVTADHSPDRPYNAAEIRALTGTRILGTLRHCPSLDADALADAAAADLDLRPILNGALAA